MSRSYAIAASWAYVNVIKKYSSSTPSLSDCINIAAYNGMYGGVITKSLEILEQSFKFGIKFKEQNDITTEEANEKTSILRFTTSNKGWENVASGELITRPYGCSEGWHAVLVDGYDNNANCFICKNTWESNPATFKLYFKFKKSAAHDCQFVTVYMPPKLHFPFFFPFFGKIFEGMEEIIDGTTRTRFDS